jgi:hypothetical protein
MNLHLLIKVKNRYGGGFKPARWTIIYDAPLADETQAVSIVSSYWNHGDLLYVGPEGVHQADCRMILALEDVDGRYERRRRHGSILQMPVCGKKTAKNPRN